MRYGSRTIAVVRRIIRDAERKHLMLAAAGLAFSEHRSSSAVDNTNASLREQSKSEVIRKTETQRP
jgi:hypothetical protein